MLLLTAEELRLIERLLALHLGKAQRRAIRKKAWVIEGPRLAFLEALHSQIYHERLLQERGEKAKAERLAEGRS